jgi:PAS domain S-box-containing protein
MRVSMEKDCSQDLFRLLFERMADAGMILEGGVIVDCNRAAVAALGYSSKKQLLARSLADLSPQTQPDGRSSIGKAESLMALALRERSLRSEWLFRHVKGQVFPVEILFTVLADGELKRVGAVWRDISKRKRFEAELQLAHQTLEERVEERTRQIERQQQVAEGLGGILDILNSNRTMQEILDYIVLQTAHLLGNDAGVVYLVQGDALLVQASLGVGADLLAEPATALGEGPTGRAVSEKRPVVVPNTLAWHDSAVSSPQHSFSPVHLADHYHALLAVPLTVKDHAYGAITLYYRDSRTFSDEEIALAVAFGNQAALAIENAYLRVNAEEAAAAAERDRIARDLHDSVTQTLFSATLIAQVLPRLWEQDINEGQTQLEELRLLTRGALAEMRTLLLELRPATLAKVALPESLRHLVEAAIGRSGNPVSLVLEGETALSPDVKVALYRIAQEALNNIVKHAEATMATVRLVRQARFAQLDVSDNGIGFCRDKIPDGHLGLGIMVERAKSIGATLNLETSPGQGTHISVTWGEPPKEG